MMNLANPGAVAPTVRRGAYVNSISGRIEMGKVLFFGPKSYFTEYMLDRIIRRCEASWEDKPYQKYHRSGANSSKSVTKQNFTNKASGSDVKQSSLSPELRDHLLGKAPLRLIVSWELIDRNVREETLECGHKYTAYSLFEWSDGHLLDLGYPAKRRRCQPCKKLLGKKPSQSVGLNQEKKTA